MSYKQLYCLIWHGGCMICFWLGKHTGTLEVCQPMSNRNTSQIGNGPRCNFYIFYLIWLKLGGCPTFSPKWRTSNLTVFAVRTKKSTLIGYEWIQKECFLKLSEPNFLTIFVDLMQSAIALFWRGKNQIAVGFPENPNGVV